MMELAKVVPFGRALDEYQAMFALTAADLDKRIIGVADGPTSFNSEMTARGKRVVSVDPLYVIQATDIESQFHLVVDGVIAQIEASPDDWVWTHHESPEHLKQNRLQVMNRFVADFETGKADRRYLPGELPSLDFSDAAFDLALCSHFLFLYSDRFSYAFHRQSVLEMLRVAEEVRIFPLLTLALERSPYLQQLIDELGTEGYSMRVEPVAYELQKGGNEMLRIWKPRMSKPGETCVHA